MKNRLHSFLDALNFTLFFQSSLFFFPSYLPSRSSYLSSLDINISFVVLWRDVSIISHHFIEIGVPMQSLQLVSA